MNSAANNFDLSKSQIESCSKSPNPIKPFLRWAGSKRQIVPQLGRFWTGKHKRYIEPFLGSGSLFFHIAPMRGVLNDLNCELIKTFKVIKTNHSDLHAELSTYRNSKEDYYRIRNIYNSEKCKIKKAAQFIYLNRYCFNGLYRTNSKGAYNVPYSGVKTGDTPNGIYFKKVNALLKNIRLSSCDFEGLINKYVTGGDFVYLDPPYLSRSMRVFNEYGPKTFCEHDFERLADCLDLIHSRGSEFVLSCSSEMPEIGGIRKWTHYKIQTMRNIASDVSKRKTVTEYIITNSNLSN